jgi:hypothetical protein
MGRRQPAHEATAQANKGHQAETTEDEGSAELLPALCIVLRLPAVKLLHLRVKML